MVKTEYYLLLKKLEKNLLKYTILTCIFFIVILMYTIYYTQKQKIQSYENNLNTQIDTLYTNQEENIVNSLTIIIKRILHDNKTVKLFKNQEREKLYLHLIDEWGFLVQNNMYLKVLQFHNADGTSFLRMHMSNKHSDNIAKKRMMLKEIHKYHKPLVGYERGAYKTVLRVINPIFSDSKYIGALEIGIDLNYFINNLNTILDVKGFKFIDKQKFNSFSSSYDFEVNNMVIEYVKNEDDLKILKHIPKNYNFNSPINIEIKTKNRHYYIVPINMKDFKGDLVATILILKDVSMFINNQESINFIGIIAIIIVVFSFYYFIKKYIKFFEKNINSFFSDIINKEKDQKNYLKIVENISSNFSITTDGEHIISINETCLKFFKYDNLDDFKKEHDCICDFFIEENGFIHKNMGDLDWISYIIQHNNKQNRVMIHFNKKDYIFMITAQKFIYKNEDRYLVILTNITKLTNLQKKFEYIIQRNKLAEEGAKIGILDWSITDNTVYYSPVLKSIFGYEKEENLDSLEDWHKKIHPDDIDDFNANLDKHLKKNTDYFRSKHRVQHKNGSYIHTQFHAKAIFKNSIPIRMVGVYTDITREYKSLQIIKEQEHMMLAQSRLAAMGEMIGMIAHQWRQPISSIAMGINNIQLDIELNSIDMESLKIECKEIIDQTTYLSNTIDDFRDFFKEDKEKVLVSIESVVDESVNLMSKSLENNDIHLIKEYFHTNKIETLPREISQVLINLIKNAKEALIERKNENKQIGIYTTEDENYVYIDIKDNAGGIEKNIINKIFQPYFTTKEEYNGTGLGLYMSKIIAQKHLMGDLSVKNSQTGAIFTLSIKKG